MNQHGRLQITFNGSVDSDIKLQRHLEATKSELNFKSDAAALRHILERDRRIAKVYGTAWDWRTIIKAPPWMEKVIGAITAFDGRARVIIEDAEDTSSRVEFGEGMFDE